MYSPELNLLAETKGTAINYEYVWFGGQHLAQISSTGAVAWYFNDHLGTPILQTSAAGAVVWRAEREPFGEIVSTRAGAGRHRPLSLPGQEDDSSDRSYNIFRWYWAGWGRYTQADPIGLNGGPNLYGYVQGNPVKLVDPLGLVTWNCTVSNVSVGHAIVGFADMQVTCFGPCKNNRKWCVELDLDLAGFSVGVPPVTWGSGSVDLVDQYDHANPDNLRGPAIIKNLSAHLGWGYGHTEYSIGWATGESSGWRWGGGVAATVDALSGQFLPRNETRGLL